MKLSLGENEDKLNQSLISECADNNKPLISSLLPLLNYFLPLVKTKILMFRRVFLQT